MEVKALMFATRYMYNGITSLQELPFLGLWNRVLKQNRVDSLLFTYSTRAESQEARLFYALVLPCVTSRF